MGGMFFEKSDGYSFGFLQLEIITGKKNTSFYSNDQHIGFLAYQSLTILANIHEILLGMAPMEWRGLELVDEVLVDSYSPSESHGFLFLKPKDIAYACVKFQIGKRMELHTVMMDFCLSLDRRRLDGLLGVEAMMPSRQYHERFSLWGAQVNRDGLVTLLRGCRDLVRLDARDCYGFDENDDEISKLESHISKFMCEGSEFPEFLCGMDNFVLPVDGYSFHLHVEETWDEMLNYLSNAFNDLGDEE
ncbi:unnamed protein product [Prunus armeniaca]